MGGAWRTAIWGLAAAAAALAYLGSETIRLADDAGDRMLRLGAVGFGAVGLLLAFSRLVRHFRDLERLREAVGRGRLPEAGDRPGDEVGRLASATAGAIRRDHRAPDRVAARLSTIIALAEEAMVVLDDFGRVEMLNPAAGWLLGLQPGADIYETIDRPDLFRLIERAREQGQTIASAVRRRDGSDLPVRIADLGLQAGVVLAFPVRGGESHPRLGSDRSLVLRPVARGPVPDENEPLAALPFVALWVATNGPEPGEGRVTAIGTMRLAGARIFRTVSLVLAVDPGEPLSESAAAREGVGVEMAASARPFAMVWPTVRNALHHCVAVGFGVDAALAALARECAAAGLAEPALPPGLDLGRLAGGLDPAWRGLEPGALAAVLGVAPTLREGAEAPVTLVAEIAAALLIRLDERGIVTHGQARQLADGESLAGEAAPAKPPAAAPPPEPPPEPLPESPPEPPAA